MSLLDVSRDYFSRTNFITGPEIQKPDFNDHCYRIVTHSIVHVRDRLLALPKGSWLFWDLDDTLWVADEYTEERTSSMVHAYYANRLVENETKELIRDLKENGIYVFGLTRRLSSLHESTLTDLIRLGVCFSQSYFPPGLILKDHDRFPAVHKFGVIYASDFMKGEVVEELLNKAKILDLELPPEIGLIDDLIENLNDLGAKLRGAKGIDIPFLEIHYTAVGKTPKPPKEISDETKKAIRENCFIQ